MLSKRRIAYLAHAIRSDWNNGNAHFQRGLLRSLLALGNEVAIFEPTEGWSSENLETEPDGARSLREFALTYPELEVSTYAELEEDEVWLERLRDFDVVVLHEWNPRALSQTLLRVRDLLGFKLVFHDTHHRASSTPEQMSSFGLSSFDGVVAFGDSLRAIYQDQYGIKKVWTLHEAADTTVFKPLACEKTQDVVWIGNWGDGERSDEIREFLLDPLHALKPWVRATIYGVRYPDEGLAALSAAGIFYGGYLPNLDAPMAYSSARVTVHIPRQQYTGAMHGIPTIRVFEALACGIPLVSAPWQDSEHLFRPGDLRMVEDGAEMRQALEMLLTEPNCAADQAARGLEQVAARHTCMHRAQELMDIFEELGA